MYFWEDDDPDEAYRRQEAMRNKALPPGQPMNQFGSALASGQQQFTPELVAAVQARARSNPGQWASSADGQTPPALFDGFHGPMGTSSISQMSGMPAFSPGAGWGANAAPDDGGYANGMAASPRQWTPEDLEPTQVLGSGGFNFTRGSRGSSTPSANLPLFAADMAQRSQGLNFAAELAAGHNRQMFQASEGDKNRQVQRDVNEANNASKKNQTYGVLASDAPPEVKEQALRDAEVKGHMTAAEAGDLRASTLIRDAKKRFPGGVSDPKFWMHIQSNAGNLKVGNDAIIRAFDRESITAPEVSEFADPGGATQSIISKDFGGLMRFLRPDKPDVAAARGYAGSLLQR